MIMAPDIQNKSVLVKASPRNEKFIPVALLEHKPWEHQSTDTEPNSLFHRNPNLCSNHHVSSSYWLSLTDKTNHMEYYFHM